jgi:ZIP family zinc transporter/zinc and cadmium transporter
LNLSFSILYPDPMPQKLTWLSLVLTGISALGNLTGGLFVVSRKGWDESHLKDFLALGAGFMLAVAILEMLPESQQLTGHAPLLILAGYFLVHFFEHTLAEHFHFGEEVHVSEVPRRLGSAISFIGLFIHSYFDGLSIASGSAVRPSLGFLVFGAVLLHKLPEGFTIASIVLSSGGKRSIALIASAGLGFASLVGAASQLALPRSVGYSLALSAGVALYLAASDLIPEVNRERGYRMAIEVFAGALLFYVTKKFVAMAVT